jgi:hypothetical protein
MSPSIILVFAEPILPSSFHDFIHSLGGARDPAMPTRLRLSHGRDHVWACGPDGETAGATDVESEAEYDLKLGNRPRANVTLELSRSAGSPALAMEAVEAAVGKWGDVVVDNGDKGGVFTVEELRGQGGEGGGGD